MKGEVTRRKYVQSATQGTGLRLIEIVIDPRGLDLVCKYQPLDN